VCQSTKPNTVHPKPPMLPIMHDQQRYPFQTIAMDLITDLPTSERYNSILMIVNHGCSKAAIFLPCHKMIDAVGVATLYVERVFPFYRVLHGLRTVRFSPRYMTYGFPQFWLYRNCAIPNTHGYRHTMPPEHLNTDILHNPNT
jgi:hypothetical protein